MEKAYDVKELVVIVKESGLELAEDAAGVVFLALVKWLEESAKLSETPYDDMLMVILPKLKEIVMEQVDKIDGKEG